MKNMNNKTKKWITVAGCLVVCAVLLGLIGNQFKTEPPKDEPLPTQSSQTSEVTVNTPNAEKEVVVAPPEIPKETPTETLPPQTDLPEQKIQPDPVKPKEPEKPKSSDGKDRTPSSDKNHEFEPESSNTPPTYKPEDVEKKTEESKPQESKPPESKPQENTSQSQPQGGETENGKIYVPGFGWIDEIGEGQGTTADDMYENGNKIGIMD